MAKGTVSADTQRNAVGAPEPGAPEAEAGAPTLNGTSTRTAEASKDAQSGPQADEAGNGDDVAKTASTGPLAAVMPKPVEVTSAPETPVNTSTPAGGTPRPELKIAETTSAPTAAVNGSGKPDDSAPATHTGPEAEPVVAPVSVMDAAAAPIVPEPGAPVNGKPTTTGNKRKADSLADATDSVSQPTGKKAKTARSAPTNGDMAKKVGRPKKNKAAPVIVGKTARKTRSQGPVDG
ncbi:hypothetical protein CDD82_6864 [Ophiocordyceps australis]|uniref:Uncharacterized protein n=1 Tax=Ophiocordyceps australis TaxID=1399860 RepID=A0A2C5YQ49_9HYPO|nr:hypothetical protein CDD82_6864 [Ophiocordyceps australis]